MVLTMCAMPTLSSLCCRQREPVLRVRGGRVAADGAEEHRGVERVGLHQRQSRAKLRSVVYGQRILHLARDKSIHVVGRVTLVFTACLARRILRLRMRLCR